MNNTVTVTKDQFRAMLDAAFVGLKLDRRKFDAVLRVGKGLSRVVEVSATDWREAMEEFVASRWTGLDYLPTSKFTAWTSRLREKETT